MAIVQFTGVVNQVRGKLNGSVFNKSRNVNTLGRKQQAPRRNVGFQAEVRSTFSAAQRSWKDIGPSNQSQWALAAANNPSRDRFGNLVALSGYNQYIKAFMLATYAGVTPPLSPDTSPAADPQVTASDVTELSFASAPSGDTVISYEAIVERANDDAGFYIILDVGLPISAGVTVYYGRYSFVDSAESDESATLMGSTSLGTRYPMPQLGQFVNARLRVVYVPNGSVVFEDIILSSVFITP